MEIRCQNFDTRNSDFRSFKSDLSPLSLFFTAVRSRLLRLRSLWDEIRQRAEEREGKLNDVLDLAGKFWADVAALLSTLRDSQDIVKELEDPGVDPSLIKQQIEAAEVKKLQSGAKRDSQRSNSGRNLRAVPFYYYKSQCVVSLFLHPGY